ncbi:MmgE/PrpD family protein [Hwanghaeella sp.]|uniref:MmgE/PrpD family protein n=1 Tax=Hwanghaeella sp. TaxID=2605943 RepID=UPI003CCBC64C
MNDGRVTPEGPTAALGAFVAGLRFEDLPAPVVRQATDFILDAVGCAIGAWRDDPEKARILSRVVATFHSSGASAIWGSPGQFSDAALTALANGALVNAADFDDTHKRALLHTGSVVVPPVLALAAERGLSGRDVITAVVAGYEVAVRVGMSVMPSHYRYWHSTATNGTFGAAAAAAKAMGLDAEASRMALGFAGTQAAGLNTFFTSGDMTKSLHPGKAAFNGILSARLAAVGGTAPPTMLEHEKGYLAAFSTEPKPDALVRGLGREWEILQNGFKFFPSILASHSPIQATLAIVTEHDLSPDRIAAITNETYNTVKTHFSAKDVTTSMGARVSVPYCCAVAALDRQVGQAQFTPERVGRTDVQDLLARTEVVADADLNALYPDKFPARVTITTTDGQRFTASRDFPKGDPQDPLTPAEIEAKFADNVSGRFDQERTRRIISLVRALDDDAPAKPLLDLLADKQGEE